MTSIRNWRGRFALPARVVVVLCATGLTFPCITNALAGHHGFIAWVVDLAAHWQWLYLAGLVSGAIVASLVRRRWLFALLLLPLPWWSAAPGLTFDSADREALVVIGANVHLDSHSPAALDDWLSTDRPDLLVLVEVSPAYADGLARLPGLPFRHLAPSPGPFGMAVLSRHPMQATTLRDADGITHIEARIEVDGTCIDLIAVHPMPPLSPRFHATRDSMLRALALRASNADRPTLVVGDLNATPWSSAFAGLAARGLRRASGLRPTWPSAGHGWFGIPIDHVLASEHWRVRAWGIGPDLGSDHRPVHTRLVLAARGVRCAFGSSAPRG